MNKIWFCFLILLLCMAISEGPALFSAAVKTKQPLCQFVCQSLGPGLKLSELKGKSLIYFTASRSLPCHVGLLYSASLYQARSPAAFLSIPSSHAELVSVGILISKPHSFSLELSGYLFVCLSWSFHQYVETPVVFPSYLQKPSNTSVKWSDSHIGQHESRPSHYSRTIPKCHLAFVLMLHLKKPYFFPVCAFFFSLVLFFFPLNSLHYLLQKPTKRKLHSAFSALKLKAKPSSLVWLFMLSAGVHIDFQEQKEKSSAMESSPIKQHTQKQPETFCTT